MSQHIAIYARASNYPEDQQGQISDLEQWAGAQASEVVWYQDECFGKSNDRPGWDQLETAMRSGLVSRVVCWRLDRLGKTVEGLTTLFEDLIAKDIGLFSLREDFDLATVTGRTLVKVLTSVAAYEDEIRTEDAVAGRTQPRMSIVEGVQPGRQINLTDEQKANVLSMRGKRISLIADALGFPRAMIYRLFLERISRAS